MKTRVIKYLFLFVVFATIVESADAQRRGRRTTRRNNGTRNNAAANVPPPVVKDTTPSIQIVQAADTKVLPSMRNDAIIERNLIRERTPLEYEHIREDDAVYRQRIWREIDVKEKMNLPFVYAAKEDNGDQHFISILLDAVKKKEVIAFSNIDDRFTTPLTEKDMNEQVGGKADTIETPDPNDPTGQKMIKKITFKSFNPDDVIKYRIKEEWVFDKESSRMHVRLLGIAPIVLLRNSSGDVIDPNGTAMFWIYPTLAKYEAYNGKNYGARMSWDVLLESRMFSSYITKSTLDNPYDLRIRDYISDPILRLLEGDNIKERIFNYEQDLWSY
jgi:gliding motility associated protien GldN